MNVGILCKSFERIHRIALKRSRIKPVSETIIENMLIRVEIVVKITIFIQKNKLAQDLLNQINCQKKIS